jgi:hypothetical protein
MKLRGHHLICLHFFRGKGYNEDFRENLSNLLTGIERKEIIVTTSADDVCKKCPYLKDGLCNYENNAENEIIEMDKRAITLLGIRQENVKWREIKEKLPLIFKGWMIYCKDCDWADDCKDNNEWRRLSNLR